MTISGFEKQASSYVYKDLLALCGVKKPLLPEKILNSPALKFGSEISLLELSQLLGTDAKTIDPYIHLL